MEAPDKIYMPNELLTEEWQRHIEGQDTCYIRKDSLLEWMNGMVYEYNLDRFDDGFNAALGQVIDKIESL